jgi:hypothetical protein
VEDRGDPLVFQAHEVSRSSQGSHEDPFMQASPALHSSRRDCWAEDESQTEVRKRSRNEP